MDILLNRASVGLAAAVDPGLKDVRVFQTDHLQKRRIFAEVRVHASVDQVWRVITDYDHLADFVPNLVSSERLPCTIPGRIHLRQLGCSQSIFWRLEAEAVLECVEVQKTMGAKELKFKAIEGDFKARTTGKLHSKPSQMLDGQSHHTFKLLCVHINIEPTWTAQSVQRSAWSALCLCVRACMHALL